MVDSRWWKRLALATVLLYVGGALALVAQRPGLQYDEALLVLGAVHARHSATTPNYAHDEHTWICPAGRCVPLMTMRYVGALKEWLCWPLFAVSDSRTLLIRLVSVSLGALGLLGVVVLVGTLASWRVATFTGLVLAINPSYADLTAFDNGTVSPWMAAMGLLALAGAAYLHRPALLAAFAIGAAAGFGIWARANFVWLLMGVAIAAAIVGRRSSIPPVGHLAAGFAGGLVGGAPFLVYNLLSRGGTLGATQFSPATGTWWQVLQARFVMLSEVMLANREHRAMWGGGPLIFCEAVLPGLLTLIALVLCFRSRDRWARTAAVAFLATGFWFFSSSLAVAEHHLIALLPFAAICWVLATEQSPKPGLSLGALYALSALVAYGQAIEGLARTGGTGQWSSAIVDVARELDQHQRGRLVKMVDWGLENNLYVLLDGRLKWRNIYPDSTEALAEGKRTWIDELRGGGLYLLNGPHNRQFPLASEAFLRTLAASRAQATRQAFRERGGRVYAELIEVTPGTAQDLPAPVALELEGVHALEASGWRWTQRSFKVRWKRTASLVTLQVHVPSAVLDKLGPLRLNGTLLEESKQYTITKPVGAGEREAVFTLDKFLTAGTLDQRELGVILVSAVVE